MTLSNLDLAIVVIYAVCIFVLAQWVSREKKDHRKDAQDYFLASRALPWWAIGTSLRVELRDIDYSTSTGFNVASWIVIAILPALYAWWW